MLFLFEDPICLDLLHFRVYVMPRPQLKYLLEDILLIQSFLIYLRSESDLSQFCLYKSCGASGFLVHEKWRLLCNNDFEKLLQKIGHGPKT